MSRFASAPYLAGCFGITNLEDCEGVVEVVPQILRKNVLVSHIGPGTFWVRTPVPDLGWGGRRARAWFPRARAQGGTGDCSAVLILPELHPCRGRG